MSTDEVVTTRTQSEMCSRCGYVFDTASTPKAGDISICLNCGLATIFTDDLRKRPMTEQERMELPRETRQMLRQAKRNCMIARGENLATRGGRT